MSNTDARGTLGREWRPKHTHTHTHTHTEFCVQMFACPALQHKLYFITLQPCTTV